VIRAAASTQTLCGSLVVEVYEMKTLMVKFIALALLLFTCTLACAQDESNLRRNIERILKEKEPEWLCKQNVPSGEPGPASPHGTFYNFTCKHQQQTVSGSIFFGDSKQDAVKMLERSQLMLQINASKPQDGIGEQAYAYTGHGSAWITFRKGNVFGQLDVGVVDSRTVGGPSLEMDAFTKQAFDIAKKFALDLAQYTGAT
jgi:hypothetical protein